MSRPTTGPITGPVVGYYVHHQGRGHLHRALALGRELTGRGMRVVFLSSLAAPGAALEAVGVEWVSLPRDDDGVPTDESPGGLLHWAPRHHSGLRARMARVSLWIASEHPDLVVSDVSQEIALLCRLHGVPVISVVLPGDRGDPPHQLGLGVSERLVGFWPPAATRMVSGLPPALASSLTAVGAMSRFAPLAARPRGAHRLVVLSGQGGDAWSAAELAAFCDRADGWELDVLGPDSWSSDPWQLLQDADLVVTRAGQASIAEVAAARVPAIVVPAERPHAEQTHTAAQLDGGCWPALVRPRLDVVGAADLAAASNLDGAAWSSWCDGGAATRFADVVGQVARG